MGSHVRLFLEGARGQAERGSGDEAGEGHDEELRSQDDHLGYVTVKRTKRSAPG